MTTIRTQVREAVQRAWDQAVADGRLPPLPDEAARPVVEVEHPADPGHGDFASNLAMRLARPYRMAPLAIAEALKAALTALAATDPASTPIASADVAPPGFLNLRLTDRVLETVVADDPSRTGTLGSGQPRRRESSTWSSSRPTRPGRSTSAMPGARSSATS